MRISDWSSDVCASDLNPTGRVQFQGDSSVPVAPSCLIDCYEYKSFQARQVGNDAGESNSGMTRMSSESKDAPRSRRTFRSEESSVGTECVRTVCNGRSP